MIHRLEFSTLKEVDPSGRRSETVYCAGAAVLSYAYFTNGERDRKPAGVTLAAIAQLACLLVSDGHRRYCGCGNPDADLMGMELSREQSKRALPWKKWDQLGRGKGSV